MWKWIFLSLVVNQAAWNHVFSDKATYDLVNNGTGLIPALVNAGNRPKYVYIYIYIYLAQIILGDNSRPMADEWKSMCSRGVIK